MSLTVWHLAGRVADVPPVWSPLAYYFTWDMFPFYYTETVQRVAVGETAGGTRVRLVPSAQDQFRAGVHGDMPRVDLERPGAHFAALAVGAAERFRRQNPQSDPLARVSLYEQYWPAKFNDAAAIQGLPPARRYWRLRARLPPP